MTVTKCDRTHLSQGGFHLIHFARGLNYKLVKKEDEWSFFEARAEPRSQVESKEKFSLSNFNG